MIKGSVFASGINAGVELREYLIYSPLTQQPSRHTAGLFFHLHSVKLLHHKLIYFKHKQAPATGLGQVRVGYDCL